MLWRSLQLLLQNLSKSVFIIILFFTKKYSHICLTLSESLIRSLCPIYWSLNCFALNLFLLFLFLWSNGKSVVTCPNKSRFRYSASHFPGVVHNFSHYNCFLFNGFNQLLQSTVSASSRQHFHRDNVAKCVDCDTLQQFLSTSTSMKKCDAC